MLRVSSAVLPAVLALSLLGANLANAGAPGGDGGGKNGGGGSKNGGGSGGGSSGGGVPDDHGGGGGGLIIKRVMVCVINNQVVRVRRVEDCGQQIVVRRHVKKYSRTVRYSKSRLPYCAPGINKNSGGYAYGGGYAYSGGGFVGSPAAVMQARRRAAGGAIYGGGYYVEQPPVVIRQHKRRHLVTQGCNFGCPTYNPGIVVHYGTPISKGGGY